MAASNSGGKRDAIERSKDGEELSASAILLLQLLACSLPGCLLEILTRLQFEACYS